MLRIDDAPEDVADPIGKLEALHDQIVVALQQRLEQLPRARDRPLHVVPEDLLGREALRDRPGVDLPADGLVQPLLLRQFRRPIAGRRNAEARRETARIEVDR
jgi:hypothetical protein